MVRRQTLIAGGLALLAVPAPALAQAWQCRLPQAPVTVPSVERDGPMRAMPVTGYTLALSWSPEFCKPRTDSARHARQCSGAGGRFGFVVHGLWPEGRGGNWPQWCSARRRLSPQTLARNLCITPDAALVAREWAKHGACMVNRPETYLAVTRVLWNSLRWPDFMRLSRRDGLTAGAVREAFAEANPHWEVAHVGLKVNARGWLEEMRLCYAKDFKPKRCEARRYGPDDDVEVKIWRGL